MFRLNPSLAVYLHREPIDFRKNINGLAALEHLIAKLRGHDRQPSTRPRAAQAWLRLQFEFAPYQAA